MAQSSELEDLRRENECLRRQVAAALVVIERGIDIVTDEQLGQWAGVRTWLEMETENYTGEMPS